MINGIKNISKIKYLPVKELLIEFPPRKEICPILSVPLENFLTTPLRHSQDKALFPQVD
jgi:hypothetical protein